MQLIGMFDSPFVRRVAVTLDLYGMAFEHQNWSVGKDFETIRAHNPLGRVPALILDDGEVLIDSAAILDHLDELAGPQALIARSGASRRAALRLMAIATGAADKGVVQLYERRFRPEEKVHEPWLERCRAQVEAGLGALEAHLRGVPEGAWMLDDRFGHADLTAACAFTFLYDAGMVAGTYPRLRALTDRVEAMPEMAATRRPFHPPKAP